MEKINTQKFNELINGDKVVFCDFYADWCGPCRMLGPVLEEISADFEGQAHFVKVNVDEEGELAMKYGIMSIPFIGVFKGGELVAKSVGFGGKSQTRVFIEENLK